MPFFKPRRKRFISKPRDGIIFSIHEWDEYCVLMYVLSVGVIIELFFWVAWQLGFET